jgi:Flp pilus assembly protein TadD
VKDRPEDARAWYHLGTAFNKLDKADEAVRAFRQVVKIEPDSARAYYFLGVSYDKKGHTEEAHEAYRRAEEICSRQGNVEKPQQDASKSQQGADVHEPQQGAGESPRDEVTT